LAQVKKKQATPKKEKGTRGATFKKHFIPTTVALSTAVVFLVISITLAIMLNNDLERAVDVGATGNVWSQRFVPNVFIREYFAYSFMFFSIVLFVIGFILFYNACKNVKKGKTQ